LCLPVHLIEAGCQGSCNGGRIAAALDGLQSRRARVVLFGFPRLERVGRSRSGASLKHTKTEVAGLLEGRGNRPADEDISAVRQSIADGAWISRRSLETAAGR
jgi:hypothetical protein